MRNERGVCSFSNEISWGLSFHMEKVKDCNVIEGSHVDTFWIKSFIIS